ncbi:MAG: flagellar basal body P-ring formation protein FlgA [Rhodocyclales bacterium GT-UBC]|nr:MAG: flagellar basal body P-ring formation protein FlgA [Rhodocyclales bacterium GT-UBC]
MFICRIFLLLWLFALSPLKAAESGPLIDAAERHIRIQTQGYAGKVGIVMGKVDATRLPPCEALQAYTPTGARLSGKTYIGVRCLGPNSWSILVPAQISISGNYVITARPLAAGQVLESSDLNTTSGDLSALPASVVTDPTNAIGKTLRNSLSGGQPLRTDQLIAPLVIRQGQNVRVISKGTGFAVTSEGKAIHNAAAGQVVQVRMPTGQTLSGIATSDGNVEIAF